MTTPGLPVVADVEDGEQCIHCLRFTYDPHMNECWECRSSLRKPCWLCGYDCECEDAP